MISLGVNAIGKSPGETQKRSLKGRSKRYKLSNDGTNRFIELQPLIAIKKLKEFATTNFTETVEVHARLNLNTKYNDQQLRSTVLLPKGSGKTTRVAVITQGDKIME